jgi:hypothetical protein
MDRREILNLPGGKGRTGMAVHRGGQWTLEEDRLLLEFLEAGKSWVFISAKLKRTVRSLQDRNRYLKRQSSTPST